MFKTNVWLLASLLVVTSAEAQQYRSSDMDLQCVASACAKNTGRKVWVPINVSEMCESITDPKRCKPVPINTGMTITSIEGSGLLDTFYQMQTFDGRKGYIRTANGHLLTFTDPRPAIDAAKKKAATAEETRRIKREADIAILAATPKKDLEKACILSAAERLPRIPGIEIKASRATDIPAALKTDPAVFSTVVEIDAHAAGQSATYNFLCSRNARGVSVVLPLSQR